MNEASPSPAPCPSLFLWALDRGGELPRKPGGLEAFVRGLIRAWATGDEPPSCRAVPRKKVCGGKLQLVRIAAGLLRWRCLACGEHGEVRDWEETRFAPSVDESGPGASGTQPERGPSYCERLGIDPTSLEELLACRQPKLWHLFVAALLERGAPASLEEIALRLEQLGVEPRRGDLVTSLKKSWHGLEPIYRGSDGRYGLNLDARELKHLLRTALAPAAPPSDPQPPPVEELPSLPPDDQPLSLEEVEAAARVSDAALSPLRRLAAILDALGPSRFEDAQAQYARFATVTVPLVWTEARRGLGRHFRLDSDSQRLEPCGTVQQLHALRQAVRRCAQAELLRRRYELERTRVMAEYEERSRARERQEAHDAAQTRRALLRTVPTPQKPKAGVLLDLGTRSVTTYVGSKLGELAKALSAFDLVAGLDVRESLGGLGLNADDWRLSDLRPSQKSRKLESGRVLRLTPERLVRDTTGLRQPLGSPANYRKLLAKEHPTQLRKRLVRDAQALGAFYQYGALQRTVFVRSGPWIETFRADWGLPGDLGLHRLLTLAKEEDARVELAMTPVSPWEEPWSGALSGRVLSVGYDDLVLLTAGGEFEIPRYEVQAVRLLEPKASS